MAFKILSSGEIELLTENQRKSYEKELAVYNERVKFVEQMEKFENAVITPYKPKLESISVVSKAPEKTYANPEYVVKISSVAVKNAPEAATFNFDKSVTAVVPKYAKTKNVSVKHIKKAEQEKPTLPQVGKATVPAKVFIRFAQEKTILPQVGKADVPAKVFIKAEQPIPVLPVRAKTIIPSKKPEKTEQVRPNLPTAVKLQSFAELAFAPVTINNEAVKAYKPDITPPVIKSSALTLPERTQPVLPQSSVNFSEVNRFEAPKKTNPVLPKAIIPKQVNVSFKQANKTKAQLPEFLNISAVNSSFSKPNIQKAELPSAQKAVIPTKEFNKLERPLSNLPVVDTPKSRVQSYIAPELKKVDVPAFSKAAVMSKPYLKPAVDSTPKIEYPSISIAAVKPFAKVYGRAGNLPSVGAVDVPDAYANESLKKLLPLKENETDKGVLA